MSEISATTKSHGRARPGYSSQTWGPLCWLRQGADLFFSGRGSHRATGVYLDRKPSLNRRSGSPCLTPSVGDGLGGVLPAFSNLNQLRRTRFLPAQTYLSGGVSAQEVQ